jgi:hypothetical protein
VSDPTCGARFTNSSSSESGDGRGLVAIEELVGCMEVLICVLSEIVLFTEMEALC